MQFITVEVFIYLRLFLFNYRALFVCVTDKTFLRIAIQAYRFKIFRSIFGLLFCLLDKKLILRSKPIWQSMRKFSCAVWSVGTFPHMNKEETTFFSWKLRTGVCSEVFLDNHSFNYPENLVTNFSERKDIEFCCVQINGDTSTLWILITLCKMPKGLAT